MKMIVALSVIAAMASACSSTTNGAASTNSKPGPSSTVSSPADTMTSGPSTADLRSQLLSVSDLPTGWSVDSSSSDDSAAPACLRQVKAITHTAERAEAYFIKGTDLPTLGDSIGNYASAAVARQKFTSATAILNACRDISFDLNGTHITGSLGAMSFPKFGDQSAAWQMTLSAEGETAGGDAVLIQKGQEMTLLLLLDLSPSTDDLQAFCTTAVAKLP